MFEVIADGNGWRWQMVSAAGRVLVYSLEVFTCDGVAAEAAKAYRRRHWAEAAKVDHRMAACR